MKKVLLSIFALAVTIGANAQVDRSKVPDPQPNPEININIPDVVTYDNGLKVIVVENDKLPVVSFQLYVDYPILKEGDKAGTGQLFGEMLGSGTSSLTKDEFDAKIDYMGASFFPSGRGFFASSLKKHTPNLLGILSEVKKQIGVPVLTDVHEDTPMGEVADVVDIMQTPAFLCRTHSSNVIANANPVSGRAKTTHLGE